MILGTVRANLAERFAAITGLNVSPHQPGSPTTPGAFVGTARVNPRAALDGSADVSFDVVVLVSRGDNTTGQDRVDEFMSTDGPSSVVDALYDDIEYAVTDAVGPTEIQLAGVSYFGAVFTVDVLT